MIIPVTVKTYLQLEFSQLRYLLSQLLKQWWTQEWTRDLRTVMQERKYTERHLGKAFLFLMGSYHSVPFGLCLDWLWHLESWCHQPEDEANNEEGGTKRWKEPDQPTLEPARPLEFLWWKIHFPIEYACHRWGFCKLNWKYPYWFNYVFFAPISFIYKCNTKPMTPLHREFLISFNRHNHSILTFPWKIIRGQDCPTKSEKLIFPSYSSTFTLLPQDKYPKGTSPAFGAIPSRLFLTQHGAHCGPPTL